MDPPIDYDWRGQGRGSERRDMRVNYFDGHKAEAPVCITSYQNHLIITLILTLVVKEIALLQHNKLSPGLSLRLNLTFSPKLRTPRRHEPRRLVYPPNFASRSYHHRRRRHRRRRRYCRYLTQIMPLLLFRRRH